MVRQEIKRHHRIFSREDASALPEGQPYIAYISYSDWMDGHSTLMHRHEDLAEILLILQGHGRYTIDLRCQEVSAGDVILCNGGALHDEFPQTNEPYQTLCMGVGNLLLPGLPACCLIEPTADTLFHKPEQYEDLKQLFCQIDRYAAEQELGYQALCQYLMLATLELIKRMVQGRLGRSQPMETSVFAQVARYLDQHYAEDIPIEQLVSQFYISPYHLSHMFKQKTGYSVKQYVLRRRIGEAQIRLANTKDTVQTISEAVGFEDTSYFSRIFSKYTGFTPTEYRKYRIQ